MWSFPGNRSCDGERVMNWCVGADLTHPTGPAPGLRLRLLKAVTLVGARIGSLVRSARLCGVSHSIGNVADWSVHSLPMRRRIGWTLGASAMLITPGTRPSALPCWRDLSAKLRCRWMDGLVFSLFRNAQRGSHAKPPRRKTNHAKGSSVGNADEFDLLFPKLPHR